MLGKVLTKADQYLLDKVVTLVCDILGSDAVGAYLFGSAVLGGLAASERPRYTGRIEATDHATGEEAPDPESVEYLRSDDSARTIAQSRS